MVEWSDDLVGELTLALDEISGMKDVSIRHPLDYLTKALTAVGHLNAALTIARQMRDVIRDNNRVRS